MTKTLNHMCDWDTHMPKHVCYYMLKSKTMSTIERRDNNYSKVPNQLNIDNGVLSKQCEDTFLNNGMRNK